MRKVEYVFFRAMCSWETAPAIHVADCESLYEARKAIKSFLREYKETQIGSIMLMLVLPDGRVVYECDVEKGISRENFVNENQILI